MADAYDMIHVAQSKLQQLICKYSPSVRKAKETVVRKDCPQSHGSGVQYSLMAQTAKASMAVYDLDSFAYNDVAKHREEGEDGGEGGLAVDDEKRHIVDLQAVGEVSHTCSPGICVGDDYDFVSSIDEFLGIGLAEGARGNCGFLRWTTGTCDSLRLLRSIRNCFRARDAAHTRLRVKVVANHAIVLSDWVPSLQRVGAYAML